MSDGEWRMVDGRVSEVDSRVIVLGVVGGLDA